MTVRYAHSDEIRTIPTEHHQYLIVHPRLGEFGDDELVLAPDELSERAGRDVLVALHREFFERVTVLKFNDMFVLKPSTQRAELKPLD